LTYICYFFPLLLGRKESNSDNKRLVEFGKWLYRKQMGRQYHLHAEKYALGRWGLA
jgi:hypothetical protein